MASFGKRFGKKKPFKNNDLPQMAQMARWKWHGVSLSQQKKKKESKRERNWNVNKPYRIVNQKVAKLAKRRAKQQFTHGSIA